MNPFTQALIKKLGDSALSEFVRAWDALETLVIRVYRSRAATEEDESEFQGLQAWLRRAHLERGPVLERYWRETKIGGAPVEEDPFERLFEVPSAETFVGNWELMRTLPAAREALNNYLVERIEAGGKKGARDR